MSDDAVSWNEVVIKSGQEVVINGKQLEIAGGQQAPILFVDYVTEIRTNNGVVCLSLGCATVDASNDAVIQLQCRLRFDLGTAQTINAMLNDQIASALKPVDKAVTN